MVLREKVLKLAHDRPEFRKYLVPLLRRCAASTPSYQEYVDKKRQKNERPLSKDKWERRVLRNRGISEGHEEWKKDEAAKKDLKKTDKSDTKRKDRKELSDKVVKSRGLKDKDLEEVQAYQKKNVKPGQKGKLKPWELKAKFLAKASPETKERMKGLNNQEFMAVLNAIMDEDEG